MIVERLVKTRLHGSVPSFFPLIRALFFTDSSVFQEIRNRPRRQRQAVATALQSTLTVISGGPSTEKRTPGLSGTFYRPMPKHCTSAVKVSISGPFTAAASRLQDGATIHSALIPSENMTGVCPWENNPLAADVVIIDEASMIDLASNDPAGWRPFRCPAR